ITLGTSAFPVATHQAVHDSRYPAENREGREREGQTLPAGPRQRRKTDKCLGNNHRGIGIGRLPGAPGAVMCTLVMDVAHLGRAGPERMTPAVKYRGAEIDKQ